jgi:hypothetical protein
MTKQMMLTFWRDDADGPACIEYSWVPEGGRRVIQLSAGQQEGNRTDPGPDDASHVQVYRLNSNGFGSDGWQFPPGPPHAYPVTQATVEVLHQRGKILGTVEYADGTTKSDTCPLKKSPLPCPEFPPES